jgi:hypothetical protein
MTAKLVRDCRIDPRALKPLEECMRDNSGSNDPANEWPGNYISWKAVRYSCGVVSRAGATIEHRHDPAELALCRRLSQQAALLMAKTYLCMGDESDHHFAPFYVAANVGAEVSPAIGEKLVRAAFGGMLWPQAAVLVEPLAEAGRWWEAAIGQPLADVEEGLPALRAWKEMVAWFHGQPELHGASFVMVNDRPDHRVREAIGCVFPRMALALSAAGSVVGLFGCVVHT